jgi:hypothetical protein
MTVSVAFYEPDPSDPTSGPVTNTFQGDPRFIPEDVSTVPIPDNLVLTDVRMWGVQSGQLVNVPYVIDPVEVNMERDRRVALGKAFDLSTYGYSTPIPVGGDPTTQTNLLGLALAVIMRNLLRDTNFQNLLASDPTMTEYRDEVNTTHSLNSLQMAMLWSLGASYVSDVFQHSWPLKEGTIPEDYADDANWPSQA